MGCIFYRLFYFTVCLDAQNTSISMDAILDLHELLKFLQHAQIPYYVKRSINLLNDLFIQRILNIIRYFYLDKMH